MKGPKQRLRIGAGKAGREPYFFVKKICYDTAQERSNLKVHIVGNSFRITIGKGKK